MVTKIWAVFCILVAIPPGCLGLLSLLMVPFMVMSPDYHGLGWVPLIIALSVAFSLISFVVGVKLWRSEED